MRRRRSRPEPNRISASEVVGSGTAVQVSDEPLTVNTLWPVGVPRLPVLLYYCTLLKFDANLTLLPASAVLKISVQVRLVSQKLSLKLWAPSSTTRKMATLPPSMPATSTTS